MIEIKREDFCVDDIVKMMRAPDIGALSIYLGTVRDFPGGVGMEFEDSDGIARKLREIEERAISRYEVEDVAIMHRVGFLGVSESILLVAVSASHREPAFSACRSIIDDMKDLHKSWGREVSKKSYLKPFARALMVHASYPSRSLLPRLN
jgi:molybdopterin synthase catalytic subunit